VINDKRNEINNLPAYALSKNAFGGKSWVVTDARATTIKNYAATITRAPPIDGRRHICGKGIRPFRVRLRALIKKSTRTWRATVTNDFNVEALKRSFFLNAFNA